MMLRIIIGDTMFWLRPYGLRRSRSLDGSSVARDSDASVSWSRLTQIICTAFIGELCTATTHSSAFSFNETIELFS